MLPAAVRRHISITALTLILIASCSADPAAEDTTATTPVVLDAGADPDPVAGALAERLGAEGETDIALAIDLFQSAYGIDLGGATGTMPTGAEATSALGIIRLHWEELTPAQQETVTAVTMTGTVAARWDPSTGVTVELFEEGAALTGGPTAAIVPAAHRIRLPRCGAAPAGPCTVGPETRALIDDTISQISRRLGRTLGLPVFFAFDPNLMALAAAVPTTADGSRVTFVGEPSGACRLILPPFSRLAGALATVENTLAHELFHCFQFALPGYRATPMWVVEGTAEWVGTFIGGTDGTTAGRWASWLATPETGLFRRSYDALGFFELMEQDGIDPWIRLDAMHTALWRDGNQAAYDVAVGDRGTTFAALIASSRVRQPTAGDDWDTRGTGVTGHRMVTEQPVAPGAPATLGPYHPGGYGSAAVLLRPTADVLTIAGGGSVTVLGFEGAPTVTSLDSVRGDFCLRSGGCTCPDGSPGLRTTLPGAPGLVAVAIGALPARADLPVTVVASVQTLEDWCAASTLPEACSLFFPADLMAVNPLPAPSFYFAEPGATGRSCGFPVSTPDGVFGGPSLSLFDLGESGSSPDAWFSFVQPGWVEVATSVVLGERSRALHLPSSSTGEVLSVIVEAQVPDSDIVVSFIGGTSSIFGAGALQSRLEGFVALVLGRWPA